MTFYTRRDFVARSAGLAAAAVTVPAFVARSAAALPRADRVLVIVQLSGGNDGLNTVVPIGNDVYYRLRPSLAIRAPAALRLTDEVGLHPALGGLRDLYDRGQLAIVQGVGYPNPDRSHFRSLEIWHDAQPDGAAERGWIGRLFDHTCGNRGCPPTRGICVDETLSPAFRGSATGIALTDPERLYRMTRLHEESTPGAAQSGTGAAGELAFLRRTAMQARVAADEIRSRAGRVRNNVDYPRDPFAQRLALTARMIAGELDTQIYYLSLTGFDTHANQAGQHERLLQQMGDAIAAFQTDLDQLGVGERVIGLTFSEFGRRVKENASGGTDHGKAAPLFVFGSSAQPGISGGLPSLAELDDGDLPFHTDFRRLYATMLDDWLGIDPQPVLGKRFQRLPILRRA